VFVKKGIFLVLLTCLRFSLIKKYQNSHAFHCLKRSIFNDFKLMYIAKGEKGDTRQTEDLAEKYR
jgi:hypothetical protein